MHTKDKLAAELKKAGCWAAADLAAKGHYDDFLSPLDTPQVQLVEDMTKVGTPAALAIRQRVINGEFDATKEEADDWAKSQDGQTAFAALAGAAGDLAKPIETEWTGFALAAVPKEAGAAQMRDMRRVFFAGALSMFNLLSVEAAKGGGMSGAFVAALSAEFDSFESAIIKEAGH